MASWSSIARRIRVPLGFAFALLYWWFARPTPVSMLWGTGLIVCGVALRAVASGHVQKNELLATSGPYAYTRNPLYLGSLILAAGFAVAAQNWWIAAALVIFFIAVYMPVIRSEEAYLRQRFPEFESYAQEVPRLLPRVRSARKPSGSFSWNLYWKHREYNALVGSGAMLVALMAKILWAQPY